jgi:hypothetical protein
MPWAYIYELLGPGLHWGKTQEQLKAAIEKAEKAGKHDAANHIRIILRMRNVVRFEKETPPKQGE